MSVIIKNIESLYGKRCQKFDMCCKIFMLLCFIIVDSVYKKKKMSRSTGSAAQKLVCVFVCLLLIPNKMIYVFVCLYCCYFFIIYVSNFYLLVFLFCFNRIFDTVKVLTLDSFQVSRALCHLVLDRIKSDIAPNWVGVIEE